MEPLFSNFDFVLLGGVLVATVIGLMRGLSGELASLVGFVAALLAGYFLYGAAQTGAASVGFNREKMLVPATVVIDVVLAILAFGIARWCVKKFVSCCLGRVTDAILGACAGAAKGLAIAGIVSGIAVGTGLMPSDSATGNIVTAHSTVARKLAGLATAYVVGARGE